jgi:4-hydroxybenzoate polyprenyltransferase
MLIEKQSQLKLNLRSLKDKACIGKVLFFCRIKSTAILFGKKTKLCLCMLYLLMILNLVSTGIVFQLTSSFYLITTVIFLHLMWQIYTLEINDPKNCLSRFKSNRWVGLAMLAAIIL